MEYVVVVAVLFSCLLFGGIVTRMHTRYSFNRLMAMGTLKP